MYWQFAWRYFKSKKTTNAINVISWVSISAIAIGTAALLIILSVFNGFEGFIKELYNSFYPEISITATTGKNFRLDQSDVALLKNTKGIRAVSYALEEKVLLSYGEDQTVAVLKGIDQQYNAITKLNEAVSYGYMDFESDRMISPIVLGIGVANKLGASEQSLTPVTCYAFRNSKGYHLNTLNAFSQKDFMVQGVFYLQDEIDEKYAFAPLNLVQDVLGTKQYSSVEIGLTHPEDSKKIAALLGKQLQNKNLTVKTRYEQNKTLFMILSAERWAVYAVLSLMLFIASFNIVGCLAMLILEKQKDIAILRTMGASRVFIRRIFLSTSLLIAGIGAIIGCSLAFIFGLLQQHFGLIKLGDDNFLVDAYPIEMKWTDFLLVLATVVVIAIIAGYWPANKAANKEIALREK